MVSDPRFDVSLLASAGSAEAGPSKAPESSTSASGSSSPIDSEEDEDASEDEDEDESDDENDSLDDPNGPVVKPLSASELAKFEAKQRKRGIVYIPRIPPGMTPPKVRHLLSGFGEVERIYLQDGRRKEREKETGKQKARRSKTFTEGWVEFSRKSVAKTIAASLNATPIGFSSGSRSSNKNAKRWKDDVWTLKYLPGFKWHMLSEQMAHERAAHASRMRSQLAQSKFEQQDYLRKVERARVQRDKEQRKRARSEANGGGVVASDPATAAAAGPGGKARTFKQRQPVLRDVRDQSEGKKGRREADSEAKSAVPSAKKQKRDVKSAGSNALDGVLGKIF